MPKININGKEIEFENGMTVLQACELANVEIPRFCYHEKLSIAGNCRMCLVELEKSNKPIASCAMPATEGMKIKTNTEQVEKARKGVMEFLLANHPLDCPVCDQGGECDLQDQSLYYGIDKSRFKENKRQVKDKYMGPLIKTQMTRCIHCTRCIRFATEVAGVSEIGALGRGEDMEITTYLEKSMQSELSANVIDLCPVGALTSKPYAFEARPWELKKTESIDVMDAVGSNIRVDTYGWEVKRILPRLNEEINEEWISDKTRYACDGLLKQRIDTPLIKKNGKFVKADWDEVIKIIKNKLNNISPEKIAGHAGDMVGLESGYLFKKFLNLFKIKDLECREKDMYIDDEDKLNYIFNSNIQNLEEADLVLLVGTNPRLEATMVNARLRKAFVKNRLNIYSIGDPGDLTYDYIKLGDDIKIFENFINNKSDFYQTFIKSKKPVVIIGESVLESKNGKYIFQNTKKFLADNNFIRKEWNALNVLIQNASTIGLIDLGLMTNKTNNEISFFKKLETNAYELLYLLKSDNLNFTKKNEFIIYQGSHGDKGAEIADIILPSASYTEQNELFINLEGRVQECRKANYPPGSAKEDKQILNLLSKEIFDKNLYNSPIDLRDEILKKVKNFSEIGSLPLFNENIKTKSINQYDESKIIIKNIDYYFSNAIARSSKTMSMCRIERNDNLKLKKAI